VWAGGLVGFGWIFRDTVVEVTRWLESLGGWALGLVGLMIAVYFAIVGWRRRRGAMADRRDVRHRSSSDGRSEITPDGTEEEPCSRRDSRTGTDGPTSPWTGSKVGDAEPDCGGS
jgi:hypothetical protein